MPYITPEQFVDRWQGNVLKERQSYQLHFLDVCSLIGHEPPGASGLDANGHIFVFEYGAKKDTGAQGFADVFYERHFGIEYKSAVNHPDLKDAYRQLQQYRENLRNPPLLVVCDTDHWEIHTNFTNTEPKVYSFTNRDLLEPHYRQLLHHLFFAPDLLRPDRDTEQVTQEAAATFRYIVDNMRGEWKDNPDRIARFLTKIVFCLFAEDIGLLPTGAKGQRGIFSEIIEETRQKPADFVRYTTELFRHMADGGQMFYREIPYFDGNLFDVVDVADVAYLRTNALNDLYQASRLDWSAIEPAIFGTLFERSLDPDKRSQLGAHYTGKDDILLIVEPVLMQPLRREWDALQAEAGPLRAAFDGATTPRVRQSASEQLLALRARMLQRLRTIHVLDPACGSGNFLYVSLQLLMDMEKMVITSPLWQEWPDETPKVHPQQLYGIEVNPIAHALASIVIWIGYLQWHVNNGFDGYRHNPILVPLDGHILKMDAIMQFDADGQPFEPNWPDADVIVGNPPFVGGNKIRAELGNEYVENLFHLYSGRIPAFADMVCYWFEKARAYIEHPEPKRVGLLATNSIRGGVNRIVLERIKHTGDIFLAWSDRPWILEGAAVRVSMVGFDRGEEVVKVLDGEAVRFINADLTSAVDITKALHLTENVNISFQGPSPKGAFDIPGNVAQIMLMATNPDGLSNSRVVKPVVNASDLMQTNRHYWTIDFGTDLNESEAAKYVEPYQYVKDVVFPERQKNNRKAYREKWWMYAEPRVGMRKAISGLVRYAATPRVAKHRAIVWLSGYIFSNDAIIVFAREDDYFFGVLHSRLHEVWSLRMGTSLEDRPRYTPTTTFETFPFPWPPGHEDTASPAYAAISAAARTLNAERDAWLNPPGAPDTVLRKRTLTNLYNALQVFRGQSSIKIVPAAGDFAPRLDELHAALDRAVCAAYGWPDAILDDQQAMLARLLALNLDRAGTDAPPAAVESESDEDVDD